jgi:hypothetical protein
MYIQLTAKIAKKINQLMAAPQWALYHPNE